MVNRETVVSTTFEYPLNTCQRTDKFSVKETGHVKPIFRYMTRFLLYPHSVIWAGCSYSGIIVLTFVSPATTVDPSVRDDQPEWALGNKSIHRSRVHFGGAPFLLENPDASSRYYGTLPDRPMVHTPVLEGNPGSFQSSVECIWFARTGSLE